MWTVKSYDLPLDKEFDLELPEGAKLLDIDLRYPTPKLFAQVSLATPSSPRKFRLLRTGDTLDCGEAGRLQYVKTFLAEAAYHLFEVKF